MEIWYTEEDIFIIMATESQSLVSIGHVLNDPKRPLKERFRALFTLKNLGGEEAINQISLCFVDPSALLKHECAFCLGQMQDHRAIPVLSNILKDVKQEAMVRHEAGEALGAIGSADVISLLEEYAKDPVIEVAETCELALDRIKWLNSEAAKAERLGKNPYESVDPAPPSTEVDIEQLRSVLLDENENLFKRYRAMFSLRNDGSKDAVLALAEGLKCSSALFRHEIAYVLGQIQSEHSVLALTQNLKDAEESGMVRHECAEALGSIATDECMNVLGEYVKDIEPVVKESCEVALDMCDYEQSGALQYADTLNKVGESGDGAVQP